jgi:hypothetical protein
MKLAQNSIFAVVLLVSAQTGEAQFVKLATEIQTVRWVYYGTNKPPTVQAKMWKIDCVVGTNTWLIEGDFPPAKHAWLFNGSNIVAHSVISEYPSERKELFERNHPEMRIGRGRTEVFKSAAGAMPCSRALLAGTDFENMAQTIPWLTFCSGGYLRSDSRRVPLASDDFWSYGIEYSDVTTVFADELGLPKAVDFYTHHDQPVCRYRVLESTNILGWNFPLRFELAQYRNEYGAGPWELNLTASGKVLSIGESGHRQFPQIIKRPLSGTQLLKVRALDRPLRTESVCDPLKNCARSRSSPGSIKTAFALVREIELFDLLPVGVE